jgi:glycosyltransferase involved in cell wall biosynthesis
MRVGINGLLLSSGASYRRTGVSRYIESLLEHLPAEVAGDEVIVYVGREVGQLDSSLQIRRAPVSVGRPPFRIAWELAALPLLTRRDGLDLFHGTVNVLPAGLGCPSVVTVHDLAFLRYPEQVTAKRYHYLKRMIGRSVRNVAAVIVPSVATGEDVADLLGVEPDRIAVVPLGVSSRFQPASVVEIERVRAKYGLSKPYVLAVGTIEPRKNLPRLIQAMAHLDSTVDEELVIAGPVGWLSAEVEQGIARSGLGERIRRPGYIEDADLAPLYSAASVVAMPSLYEGFGLPVLEALATGAVVVTSNVSSLPEVAGDAAILVDPLSVGSIAEGISSAISNLGQRERLCAAAIEQASKFSWSRTAHETMAVYRSVAG